MMAGTPVLAIGISSVIVALGTIAGLVALIYRTYFSGRATWEREFKRLQNEYDQAQQVHAAAVARGEPTDALYGHWRLLARQLADHRRAGQRAGFLRGTE